MRTAVVRRALEGFVLISAAIGVPSPSSTCRAGGGAPQLGKPVRPREEVAIRSVEQRHVERIIIAQIDAQQVTRLCLHHAPGGHATQIGVVAIAKVAIDQVPIRDRSGVAAGPHLPWIHRAQLILTQKYLVRRMRRIGLVLVHKRRGLVVVEMYVVRRIGHPIGTTCIGGGCT